MGAAVADTLLDTCLEPAGSGVAVFAAPGLWGGGGKSALEAAWSKCPSSKISKWGLSRLSWVAGRRESSLRGFRAPVAE